MVNFAEFKKFFLFCLIGSLVISAIVGVITILIGDFNKVTAKVLYTLLMVIIHSIVCLTFIWDNSKKNTFERLVFFSNVLFFLIVLSFITSIFGIWNIITGSLTWKLYCTYFVIGLSSLHGNILSKAMIKENYIDKVVYANYLFIALVAILSLPVIYIYNAYIVLGNFYYRLWGAIGIIDATLSILTMIFFKLYLHKTQTAETQPKPTAAPVQNQSVPKQK